MRLSSDPHSVNFHEIVCFIAGVTIDSAPTPNIVSIDIDAGEAVCITLPMVVKHGEIDTHIVKGKIVIKWRIPLVSENAIIGGGQQALMKRLYNDWVAREEGRKVLNGLPD